MFNTDARVIKKGSTVTSFAIEKANLLMLMSINSIQVELSIQ